MSKKLTLRPFGWRDKPGYAAGDFGCSMSCAVITGCMMLFCINVPGTNQPMAALLPAIGCSAAFLTMLLSKEG